MHWLCNNYNINKPRFSEFRVLNLTKIVVHVSRPGLKRNWESNRGEPGNLRYPGETMGTDSGLAYPTCASPAKIIPIRVYTVGTIQGSSFLGRFFLPLSYLYHRWRSQFCYQIVPFSQGSKSAA